MKRLLIGFAAVLAAGAAAGQVMECVDAKGMKEYAQTCPPGTVKETKLMKSSPGAKPAAPAAKSLAERDAEFRKRAIERQEAEAKADREKADSKTAERNCNEARAQLRALQDGQRITRTNPTTGERQYLTDDERPAEIATARKAVDSWCKN